MAGTFAPQLGDVVAERYELLAPLRSSSSGPTFLAQDEYTAMTVALTLFDPARADRTAWAAYAKAVEAAAAARIAGVVLPQSVPPAPPEPPHAAIEAPVARDLERLRDAGQVPWQRAVSIVERIAALLDQLHSATRLAHRALTPQRCLVDSQDQVQLLDFGVAELERKAGDDPSYRAPEQRDGPGDARSDVYSLAIILFELVSGERPREASRLRKLVPVPSGLDTCLTAALAADPRERPADTQAFRVALRELVGLPALPGAPPPPASEPPRVQTPISSKPEAPQKPIEAPAWLRLSRQPSAPEPAPATDLPPLRHAEPPPRGRTSQAADSTLMLSDDPPPVVRPRPSADSTLLLPEDAPLVPRIRPAADATLVLPDNAASGARVRPSADATLALSDDVQVSGPPATPRDPPLALGVPGGLTAQSDEDRTTEFRPHVHRPGSSAPRVVRGEREPVDGERTEFAPRPGPPPSPTPPSADTTFAVDQAQLDRMLRSAQASSPKPGEHSPERRGSPRLAARGMSGALVAVNVVCAAVLLIMLGLYLLG